MNTFQDLGMLPFAFTKKNILLLLALLVVIYIGTTCFLYGRLENNIGEIVQHHTVHLSSSVTEESKLCDLSSSLIKSALERAKSESCRQSLKDTYCFHLDEDIELENQCPEFDKDRQGKFVGCFNSSNLLSGYHYKFETTNDPDYCLQHCFRAGYELFGLNSGKNCFCGGIKDVKLSSKIDKSNCGFAPCPGNRNVSCGGISSTSVFSTGLPEMKRNFPEFFELPGNIEERKKVKILFVLQLNGRNTRQVKRMLRTVYSKKHLYVVHVDERQNFMYREMKKLEEEFQKKNIFNFKVAEKRFPTIWGGSTLLTMFLEIIKSTLSDENFKNWDYVLNLSESDMLLLSLEELEHNLGVNEGKSFLASHGYNTADFVKKQGLYKAFHQCEERMWRIKDRKILPKNMRLDGGSDWSKLRFFGRKFDSFINVEALEAVEKNSLRFREKIKKNEAWSSTWINVFEREVDFESRNRYIYEGISKFFFKEWTDGQEFSPCGFEKLTNIYAFKKNSTSKPLPILEILDGCGNNFQILLLRKNLSEVNPDPNMEEFEIVDSEFGTGLDLKEEVFRDVLPVVDVNSKATVLFHWRRNSSSPDSKTTSPLINIQWWNSMGRLVKNELVKPYDSIYGGQYAELDLSNLTLLNDVIPGLWSLRIPSKEGDKATVETKKELIQKISGIDSHTLDFHPSNPLPYQSPNIVVADVYSNSDNLTCSIFMLTTPQSILPLHDHPKIDGFIKPIKGKLLISSFSWLDEEEEKLLVQQEFEKGRPARFDGTRTISSDDPQVVTLGHQKGNVHSIQAVEPVSAFFDVLIPDYGERPCTYYQCDEANPIAGQTYWLKPILISPAMAGALYLTVTESEINNSN
ncbi:hypothetical protein FO519_008812 [Halicephalobus sp. NKZ332]|nr:hypothetical protein FO519_008812 [Halicephalobus sp. NKZ332]